jgi:type VI secretion system secreted protein Hcp
LPYSTSAGENRHVAAHGAPAFEPGWWSMRIVIGYVGAAAAMLALGCGGAPALQDDGEDLSARVESPLETSGQVEFYVDVKGKKQGAFKGESILEAHRAQLPAFRFDMTIESPRDAASGQPTGKRRYSPLTIVKAFGASDPQFLSAAATNEVLTEVKLHFVRDNPKGGTVAGDWQTIKLTNAFASKVQRTTISLDDAAKTTVFADEISFTFEKIEVEDRDGKTLFSDTLLGP